MGNRTDPKEPVKKSKHHGYKPFLVTSYIVHWDEADRIEAEAWKRGEKTTFGEATTETFKRFGHAVVHCCQKGKDGKLRAWYETSDGKFIKDDPGFFKKWKKVRKEWGGEESIRLWEEVNGGPF